MSGRTISEKILGSHSRGEVRAGEIVIVRIDHIMGTDGSFPLAIESMKKMGNLKPFESSKVSLVIDHYTPSPNEDVSRLHAMMRSYAQKYGCALYDVGEGICHQVIPESGKILPGDVVIGGDSHTCSYGALNLFGTGVGSTDLAASVITGKIWLKVPETIRINVHGRLPTGVYAKDIALKVGSLLGMDGATYKAIEFHGDAITQLSIDSRFTISNMAVEYGAKAGLMLSDSKTEEWLRKRTQLTFTPVEPDQDAVYSRIIDINVSTLKPNLAVPHDVDNVKNVEELEGIKINQVNIGSCTNGRLEDLEVAAKILSGKRIHKDVRLFVTPASREVLNEALRKGIIEELSMAGASIITSSCGWCCGSCNGIPADGEVVVATSNRNFQGRMGNGRAGIYLASPATAAASALKGEITDPRRWKSVL